MRLEVSIPSHVISWRKVSPEIPILLCQTHQSGAERVPLTNMWKSELAELTNSTAA